MRGSPDCLMWECLSDRVYAFKAGGFPAVMRPYERNKMLVSGVPARLLHPKYTEWVLLGARRRERGLMGLCLYLWLNYGESAPVEKRNADGLQQQNNHNRSHQSNLLDQRGNAWSKHKVSVLMSLIQAARTRERERREEKEAITPLVKPRVCS